MNPLGPLLTHWTIRLALLCYVAYCAGKLAGKAAGRWNNAAWLRLVWTLGGGLFVAHVICAFAFFHHFRHAEAFATTAQRTEQMLGFAFGYGIYFSYLFTLVWLADVLWMWRDVWQNKAEKNLTTRPRWVECIIHGYLFFIAANGALVFEGGITRWVGIPLTLGLGLLLFRYLSTNVSQPQSPAA